MSLGFFSNTLYRLEIGSVMSGGTGIVFQRYFNSSTALTVVTKRVYGFIAQQIREVIPEAVSIQKSYIPNIMLLADYNDNIITLTSIPTNIIIKQNDKIKCYDKHDKDVLVDVEEVIDDRRFRIKELVTKPKHATL
jgi:hypothetical protein